MVWAPSSINNLRLKQSTRLEKIHYELNGIAVEFIASVKYFGDPDTDGTWRIFVNLSNQLVRQRLETGSWVDYGTDGSSTSFTDILLRGTQYGLYSVDSSDVQRPLIRTAFSDEKGVAVGTKDGIFAIINDGNSLEAEPGTAYDTTRNDGTDTYESDEYEEEITPTSSEFIDTFYYYIDTVPAGTKFRIYAESTSGNTLYENVSEYEFSIGGGADVTTGENEFDLDPTAYRNIAGNTYTFYFKFSNTVKLLGKQNGTFMAKIRTVGNYADTYGIVFLETWADLYRGNLGSFTIGDTIYEDHVLYICNTTGTQATDFSTNASKWSKIGTAVLSGGEDGGQTINGGLAEGDDLTLSSTANATKGNVNLGANSTYDEVNDRLGLNTTTPTKTLDIVGDSLFTGFIQLGGSSSPSIKTKKITGTTPFDGNVGTYATGLTAAKILSYSVLVAENNGNFVMPFHLIYTAPSTFDNSYYYRAYISSANNLMIRGCGQYVDNCPFKCTIIYEE